MRMMLFEATFTRSDGVVNGHIAAPSLETAMQFADDYHEEIGVTLTNTSLKRIDEDLPEELREGLDDMLESGPIGFASRCAPLGWFVFRTIHPELKLYRIDDDDGGVTHIVAENADVASALWLASLTLDEHGCHPCWRITRGMDHLDARQRDAMVARLEFGPTAVVEWDDEQGWLNL